MYPAFVKIRSYVVAALMLCSFLSTAQQSDVLNIESDSDQIYLTPHISKCSVDSSATDSICSLLLDRIEKDEFQGAYQKLYKISLYVEDSIPNLRFVSILGNYATDLFLFYKDSKGEIVENQYIYNRHSQHEDDEWVREAEFPLPILKGAFDFYVLADFNSWELKEWYLFSEEGYSQHGKILTRQAIVYLVLVFLFLAFAVVGFILLRNGIIAYYAFYLFATSLYIFKEINTLPLQMFYDHPQLLNFINESVTGIFLLSFILYLNSICDDENSFSFMPIFFRILVVLTVVSIFITSFIIETPWAYGLSQVVNQGANVYFILQVIANFKKSIPLRFFLSGVLIIVLLGVLMELQLNGWINFPKVFYWTIPGLILELLLIGVGIIFGLKLRYNELNQMKMVNSNLNENVITLEKKVNHSKGALQTLISTRNNRGFNLPSEYLDYPLTQREIEVVQLLNKGYTNQELADEMFISRNTIKTHLKNIYKKLDVRDREEALEKMRTYGIV